MPSRKSILSRNTPGNQYEEERKESLAAYLKSYRLTRIITLQRGPRAGQQLSVADVGSADGYPVLIFLGLGCVRYLVALLDEIASAYNIRLICIDRWGLGRSTDVPQSRRGLWEWARVVEEVMDQMQVRMFGMLAHSAGAPYAMATSLHMPDRVVGRIHLLCPWAEVEAGGSESGVKAGSV
jgi:pimeloyl-ACP methyl ester carboxylesterase